MKVLTAIVLSLFMTDAFADDWRMRKFDFNGDELISKIELDAVGCKVSKSLYKKADKDNDGHLNKKEARAASNYIFRSNCPKNPQIIEGIRG